MYLHFQDIDICNATTKCESGWQKWPIYEYISAESELLSNFVNGKDGHKNISTFHSFQISRNWCLRSCDFDSVYFVLPLILTGGAS